jgi:hypothetical protein
MCCWVCGGKYKGGIKECKPGKTAKMMSSRRKIKTGNDVGTRFEWGDQAKARLDIKVTVA